MLARRAQGWTWPQVAKEAGITLQAARTAVRNLQDAAPMSLDTDPVKIVEHVFTEIQASVGTFEAIGSEALRKEQYAVAVGARRSADDARMRLMSLLQMTGRMPQDLSALRHLIDLRTIAIRMLDSIDAFSREMDLVIQLEDPGARAEACGRAVSLVQTTFNELVGIEQEPPVLEGTTT